MKIVPAEGQAEGQVDIVLTLHCRAEGELVGLNTISSSGVDVGIVGISCTPDEIFLNALP